MVVGLEYVLDVDPRIARELQVPRDLEAGVDHGRDAGVLVAHEVRRAAEVVVDDLPEDHRASIIRSDLPVDAFRTPDDRFADLPGYPFEPHYAELGGLRLHYVDEGSGSPVVCFHGEPSWSYLYRKMVPPLVEGGHRVICPDYAGFGRSDKPIEREW